MTNPIVIVGLLIVVFGAGIWAFRPPAGAGKIEIRFLGLEVSLDVPALGVMVIGVVLVIVGNNVPLEFTPTPTLTSPPPTSTPTAAVVVQKHLVCIGELASTCRARFPADNVELYGCGDTAKNAICMRYCGTMESPSTCTQTRRGGPDSGNNCGYSWVEIACLK